MSIPFCFKPVYFIAAVVLFFIEVLIALYAHDQIIRPYVGDLLVVILLYCFVKAFLQTPVVKTAIAVLAFAYALEVMQYFNIVSILGLQRVAIARIVIGTSFEWVDLIAYALGIILVLFTEQFFGTKQSLAIPSA